MKVRCLNSFATSNLSTYKGQVIEIAEQEVLNDLLLVGYVEPVEVVKTTKKKSVKTNESK